MSEYSTGMTWSSTFSPDGKLVAFGSPRIGIEFWDPDWPPNDSPILDPRYPWTATSLEITSDGREWSLWQRPVPRCLRFSPDGRLLAATAGWSIYLYDLWSLRKVASLRGHRQMVKSLDFSPDGRTLASASQDGTVRFWDVESGDERACFDWKIGAVNCVVFAPDGMTIAVGGEGGIVVWDVE